MIKPFLNSSLKENVEKNEKERSDVVRSEEFRRAAISKENLYQ
jgi:hypothetical protein